MPLLSVIVPVYNEERFIAEILRRVEAVNIDKEIIVVDDASCDGTDKILRSMHQANLKIIHHTSQRGKGAACLTGLDNAGGEYVIIQDADLEYDPNDYHVMMRAVQENPGAIILGARFFQGRQGLFVHRIGNRFLTFLLNTLFAAHLNDYATCYKLALRSTFNDLKLKSRGFDLDVEMVCTALKKKVKLIEVPVSYSPRTYREGKKIRWKDGLWAIFYIIKYRLVK